MPDFFEIEPEGKLRLLMHPGQSRAWESRKRFVVILAGTQAGKTAFTPYWLHREIKEKGPGDYLYVSPSFQLLKKKALPEFLALFEQRMRMGTYNQSDKIFTFDAAGCARMWKDTPFEACATDPPTKVFFGHAADAESLESATAKAAVLDEAGQKRFRIGSWEAVLRRLSIHRGRVLIATTPYDLGWLKTELYDEWADAGKDHPDIDVIRFDSTENPAFPPEEFERARRSLPTWKFDMFYRGLFTRTAGLIYDCFDPRAHTIPTVPVKPRWPRRLGLDFGTANTAGVFLADEMSAEGVPSGRFVVYREHRPGQRLTPKEHTEALLEGEPGIPDCWGGARSEDDWRDKFHAEGLPVREPPDVGVEAGIDAVYAVIKEGRLRVMDCCTGLLDELASYSRELDERGEPTDKIEDKAAYHLTDCLRYLLCGMLGGSSATFDVRDERAKMATASPPAGVFFETAPGRSIYMPDLDD